MAYLGKEGGRYHGPRVWNTVGTEYYGEIPSAWRETSPPPTNMSRIKIIVIVNLMNTGSNMFVLKGICNDKIKHLYYNK